MAQDNGVGSKALNRVGAKVVRSTVGRAWTKATGAKPPVPEHPDTGTAQAVSWTALSAATVAVVQVLISRELAKRRSQRDSSK